MFVPVLGHLSKDTNTQASSSQDVTIKKKAQRADRPIVKLDSSLPKQNVGDLNDHQKTATIGENTPSGVLLDIDSLCALAGFKAIYEAGPLARFEIVPPPTAA